MGHDVNNLKISMCDQFQFGFVDFVQQFLQAVMTKDYKRALVLANEGKLDICW